MSTYLANFLNNDLIDIIYTKLHNSYMKDLIYEINQHSSFFEKNILKNINPISRLKKLHNTTLQMENDIYGQIYVIMINDNQFISYHKSDDDEFNDLIIHGFIERDLIKIERIVYKLNHKIYHSIKDIAFTNYHSILYVEKLFDYYPGDLQIDLEYHSNKNWKHYEKIYEWFHDCFEIEMDLQIGYFEHLELSDEFKQIQLD